MQDSGQEVTFKNSANMGNRRIEVKRFVGDTVSCVANVFVGEAVTEAMTGEAPYTIPAEIIRARRMAKAELATDVEGIIRYVSPGFERLTGWLEEELMGTGLGMLLPDGVTTGWHKRTIYSRFGKDHEFYVVLLQGDYLPDLPSNADRNLYHRAFMSYSRRASSRYAARLAQFLFAYNLPVWLDINEIDYGADFEKALAYGVACSDRLIAFVSENYLESPYCRAELNSAIKFKKPILPVLHSRDEKLVGKFKELFPELSTINFAVFDPTSNNIAETFDTIKKFLANDQAYYRQCMHYTREAVEWEQHGRQHQWYLSESEAISAKAWTIATANKPDGYDGLVEEFINLSHEWRSRGRKRVIISLIVTAVASVITALVSATSWRQSTALNRELSQAYLQSALQEQLAESTFARSGLESECEAVPHAIEAYQAALAATEEIGTELTPAQSRTLRYIRENLSAVIYDGNVAKQADETLLDDAKAIRQSMVDDGRCRF